MSQKVIYIWGPLSSFSGPLIASLLKRGWQVHLASKSAFNLFSLSPLDLPSQALSWVERAMGGHEQFRAFEDRLRLFEPREISRSTTYDAAIFCGLPPNFDEPRAPRAPWAAGELPAIGKLLKGVPIFLVSSLWGAVQKDSVVPEELEFERRKPLSHWEGVCQQYESKLLKAVGHLQSPWYLVRLPMISGSTQSGFSLNFSGPSVLLRELCNQSNLAVRREALSLAYDPDATLWFLPIDTAAYFFCHLIEDETRPRICNLVSTQHTLNREWLQYLAMALGYTEIMPTESDGLRLPGVLRRMLNDNLVVKTRNLFEVAGRYQHRPIKLDQEYFERLIAFAQSECWGQPLRENPPQLTYSDELAEHYFCTFLPHHLSDDLLGEATARGTSIGFFIDGVPECKWLLTSADGRAHVERYRQDCGSRPHVSVHVSSDSWLNLIQGKLSPAQALLWRQMRVEGSLGDVIRVGNTLSQFLTKNRYTLGQTGQVLSNAETTAR